MLFIKREDMTLHFKIGLGNYVRSPMLVIRPHTRGVIVYVFALCVGARPR
jgi:hypothetical protein